MSKGLFITATGTDVGKTYVSAMIVKKLRESGFSAGYYKPALSGGEKTADGLIPGDAVFVRQTAGLPENPEDLVSYIYETAVSPHLAAEIEKKPIERKKLLTDFTRHKTNYEYLTVEGSGGIICPFRLTDRQLMLTDVIKAFGLSVLIVADAGLGTINGTVLTTEYARANGIAVSGIVLNRYDRDSFLHKDNRKQIERLTGLPVVCCLPENAADIGVSAEILKRLYKEID